MKNSRLYLALFAFFGLSALIVNAAQTASAKVLSVTGSVHVYAEGSPDAPLTAGAILTQGQGIVTTAMSSAHLVFSNGSELTVKENTSVTIAELTQEAFGGNKSYEQLKADPSKSQALLQLNYGKVSGHVKQLRAGSKFNIETPLGTAAIRGTKHEVGLGYNPVRKTVSMTVTNMDGKIDLITKTGGKIEYYNNAAEVAYETGVKGTTQPVPVGNTVTVSLSQDDPNFEDVINPAVNFPPYQNENTQPNTDKTTPPGPVVTPEDQTITITSPNTAG